MAEQGLKYNVDIVMCIDCTGSMGHLLDLVKTNALKFYPDLSKACAEKDKNIDKLRIKVIAFRDYNADGANAMHETEFFNMPDEESKFKSYIDSLTPDGGGDEPECGLEAVALAMNSDWTKGGDKRRHIIVVWSDASSHPLEEPSTKTEFYPANMPANFDEITDWWSDEQSGKMNKAAKRMLLYTPDAFPWTDMANHWELATQLPTKAGEGLTDVEYEAMMNTIVNSI